jgi:forkhead box protein J2/3
MTNPTSGDLDNLVDGYSDREKPPFPLSTILKFALLGSPRGKLTLAEIYETLMARFPFFKHVKTDWQNSVHHTLSLHVCFVRVARAITDSGKGSYWTYEPSRGDGINRKRKPKKQKSAVAVA